MNRRNVLAWLCRGLATTTAAVIGVPSWQYLLGKLKTAPATSASYQRVARFSDLPPGKPQLVPVLGQKQDAWTTHAEQTIGRVWLMRQDAATPADSASQPPGVVQALSSLCPHMGCQIQLRAGGQNFVCPCHKATFERDGAKRPSDSPGERNHAPRGMDRLESQVVQDAETGEWWVEVKYEKFEPGLLQPVVKA